MRRKRRSEVQPETPEALLVGCVCKRDAGGARWNTGNCQYHSGIFGGLQPLPEPCETEKRLRRTCSPERFSAIAELVDAYPEWKRNPTGKHAVAVEKRAWRWAEGAVDRAYPGREQAPVR